MQKLKSIWHHIKNVLHYVTKVIMYAIFLLLIFVGIILVLYVLDVKKNISSGVYRPPLFSAYVIVSPSMVPTIHVQDAIIVKRMEGEELKKGDIITFTSVDDRYSGATITHRIVGIEKTSDGKILFRTKGDNNNSEDSSLVPTSNINGKVILRIPKVGYIQYFLTQAYGWIIAIVIPCLGIIIYDIIKVIKLIKNSVIKKNKNDNKKRGR